MGEIDVIEDVKQVKWLLPVGCAGALAALYAATAYPGVSPYRDSGDMAAASCVLGVAHAPGYPVYILAARAWLDLLPLGDWAYRLHLLSAFCGALAAAAAALAAGPAALALLGLSPAFWRLSATSEMYSLNAAFAAALLLLMPRGEPEPDARRFYASSLVFGLGLANHQTLVLALPGLCWVWWRRRRDADGFAEKVSLAAAAALAALGLAAYLFLPLRSWTDPVVNWGEPHSLRGFWRMLTRADYGAVRLHPERAAGFVSLAQWKDGLGICLRALAGQLGWAGLGLAAWGAWSGRRQARAQGALLAALVSGPVFIAWANLDPGRPETVSILEPHLVLPLVFFAFLGGAGASDLWTRGAARPVVRGILALGAAILWAMPQAPAWASLARLRGDFTGADCGRAFLDALEPGAVLLEPDDTTAFALSYQQVCRARRPDLRPVSFFRTLWGYRQLKRRRPELLPEWEIRSGQELWTTVASHNLGRGRPVYVDLPQKTPPGTWPQPKGLGYRLRLEVPDTASREAGLREGTALSRLHRMRPAPEGADFFSRHAAAYASSALNNLGIEAQRLGRTEEASTLYRRALARDRSLSEAWNNLANIRVAQGDAPAAEGCYLAARRLRPSAPLTYNLGRVYLLSNRYEDAEREFSRAWEEAALPEAKNDLGLVYFHTGRRDRALEAWTSLLQARPDFAPSLYNLGMAYHASRDFAASRRAFLLFRASARGPEEKAEAEAWLKRLPD